MNRLPKPSRLRLAAAELSREVVLLKAEVVVAEHMRSAEETRQFQLGYALAAAQVQRSFDQPGIAAELLHVVGLTTVRSLKAIGVEDFDMEPLRKVIRGEFSRFRRRKTNAA